MSTLKRMLPELPFKEVGSNYVSVSKKDLYAIAECLYDWTKQDAIDLRSRVGRYFDRPLNERRIPKNHQDGMGIVMLDPHEQKLLGFDRDCVEVSKIEKFLHPVGNENWTSAQQLLAFDLQEFAKARKDQKRLEKQEMISASDVDDDASVLRKFMATLKRNDGDLIYLERESLGMIKTSAQDRVDERYRDTGIAFIVVEREIAPEGQNKIRAKVKDNAHANVKSVRPGAGQNGRPTSPGLALN